MSFDIFFQPCRFDGTTERRQNPFTLEVGDYPRNAPLSDTEVAAVRAALVRAGAQGSCESGTWVVEAEDGTRAEVHTSDLARGCIFAVRGVGVTPTLAALLFDVLVAGDWTMIAVGCDVAVAPRPDSAKLAPDDFPPIAVATSPDQLAAILSGSFESWRQYANSVLSTEVPGNPAASERS